MASAPNWAISSVLSRRGLGRYISAGMMFWVIAIGWLLTTGFRTIARWLVWEFA